jgi:hypothetical protein
VFFGNLDGSSGRLRQIWREPRGLWWAASAIDGRRSRSLTHCVVTVYRIVTGAWD